MDWPNGLRKRYWRFWAALVDHCNRREKAMGLPSEIAALLGLTPRTA